MVGGLEKFPNCQVFSDEDPGLTGSGVHPDRLRDVFVDQEVILNLLEEMMVRLFREILGVELERPFPRLEYGEAMRGTK